jgi:hypothetical protein
MWSRELSPKSTGNGTPTLIQRLSGGWSVAMPFCLLNTDVRPPLWYGGQSSWLHNGGILCFLWDTNWIYKCYVEESRPPLWSSGQSFWIHNGDILCFLRGTNWIYIQVCYVEESRPPLWSSGQSSWLQNGDILCFLWCRNWIYGCDVEESRPPLWTSGQSSWLQIQVPCSIPGHTRFSEKKWVWNGVHSASWLQLRGCFKEKVAASVLEADITAVGDPPRWIRDTSISAEVGNNFAKSGGRLVSIVR